MKDNAPNSFISTLRRKYIFAMVGWSVFIGISLAWNIHQEANETMGMAIASARTNIHKDIVFRKWVASHGGVYVAPTLKTPPNPYLKVPNRDVFTDKGIKLTLMNPAYALRELQSMDEGSGIRSHITSLKLLNPNNVADEWEAGVLKDFEQLGSKESMAVRKVDGQLHLRLMQPFIVTADCLKCHGQQGYKVGDIRGGISSDVSLGIYEEDEKKRDTFQSMTHGFVWLVGLLGLGGFYRREYRYSSEREQIEAARRESEELFRNYFSLGQVGMTITSPDQKWLHVNERLCEMLGYTQEELVKMTWVELTHPDDLARDIVQFNRLVAGEIERYALDKRFIHKSGDIVYTHLSVTCKRKSDRTIEYVIAALEDITERYRASEALQRSNSDLAQFAYSVSHDMRQPLRAVSGHLQLLQRSLEGKLDENERENLGFALDGAKRMDSMIVSLLDYSRVGRKNDPMELMQSRESLDEALGFLEPLITETRTEVQVKGEWPQIFASRDELTRLLQNLINNAIKFREADQLALVEIESAVQGNNWRVSVCDHGIGINPQQIDRLFKFFSRLQLRNRFEGTGMGLALCHRIVEHHGGRIWVESEGEGKGSNFIFEIPIKGKANRVSPSTP